MKKKWRNFIKERKCVNCDEHIEINRNPMAKYCKKCSKIIHDKNNLKNVKKFNERHKKKRDDEQ